MIPSESLEGVLNHFSARRILSVRINTLQGDQKNILDILKARNILFTVLPWCKDVLILENISQEDLRELDLVQEGKIYQQSLSSLLVSLVLDPQPGERVLDLCAAPGSKTTHIAMLMKNQGEIVAVETIKDRYYRLKSVVALLGATNVHLKLMDGRKYRDGTFDRILVDAPCSSEGRFHTADQKSFGFWSLRKIKEMAHKQKGLLLNASRLLKPGGMLVYSTCTFAPEENEAVVDWFLRKSKAAFEVVPIKFESVATYPAVTVGVKKSFNAQVQHCTRILPTESMDAFFMVKMMKG